MALEQEYKVFKQKLPELLRTVKGKFILIHGSEVAGCWDDENEAYTVGCQKFGTDPFLVMLVVEQENPVQFFQDVRVSMPTLHGQLDVQGQAFATG